MPKHVEGWDYSCVDKWEKWYDKYVTQQERNALNILRKKAQSPKISDLDATEYYLRAIEILHAPLIRSLKIKNPENAKIDWTHLKPGEGWGFIKGKPTGGDFGYTTIQWR